MSLAATAVQNSAENKEAEAAAKQTETERDAYNQMVNENSIQIEPPSGITQPSGCPECTWDGTSWAEPIYNEKGLIIGSRIVETPNIPTPVPAAAGTTTAETLAEAELYAESVYELNKANQAALDAENSGADEAAKTAAQKAVDDAKKAVADAAARVAAAKAVVVAGDGNTPKIPTADEAFADYLKNLPINEQKGNIRGNTNQAYLSFDKVITSSGTTYFELRYPNDLSKYFTYHKGNIQFAWEGASSTSKPTLTTSSSNPTITHDNNKGYVIFSDQLTGKASDGLPSSALSALTSTTSSKTSSLFKSYNTPNNYNTLDLNVRAANAVDAFLGDEGSWVYNPYKSKHYDSMCAPAIMFNDRKERQLLCKRLGCIEYMAKTGGPLDACEYDYDLGMCLYVDSARYKLEGTDSIGKVFHNFGKQFFNSILGLAPTITYLFIFPGCVVYQTPLGVPMDQVLTTNGWHGAACGITGSLLSIREIISFINNGFNPFDNDKAPVDLPTGSTDFCNGVDYGAKTTTT
jgi:hypothetical protein